jgi:hypothetical protein
MADSLYCLVKADRGAEADGKCAPAGQDAFVVAAAVHDARRFWRSLLGVEKIGSDPLGYWA